MNVAAGCGTNCGRSCINKIKNRNEDPNTLSVQYDVKNNLYRAQLSIKNTVADVNRMSVYSNSSSLEKGGSCMELWG